MPSRNTKFPSYRQRKGYDQALVTLTDAVTKRRRDYWLGTYGTPESRELYHRLIAEWESLGRRLPDSVERDTTPEPPTADGMTLCEVMNRYWPWAKEYYCAAHANNLRLMLRLLRTLYGSTPAAAFGPKRLRLLREELIRGDLSADPPRRPWSRRYINNQVKRLLAMFKWAASHELIPASVHHQLKTIEPLKRGRTSARETEPVRRVADELVDAVQPFVSQQVWAMIQLQRLTGARPSEIVEMRLMDLQIDDSTDVWIYSPPSHKTAYTGKARTIYLGPKAQQVLRPFIAGRQMDAPLFSATEAEQARRTVLHNQRATPMSCGNRPGTNRRPSPKRQPGEAYTVAAYRRAINRACDQAFPPPPELRRQRVQAKKGTRWETDAEYRRRLGPKRWEALRAWKKAHRWHPYQLRHSAATHIRREFGLEAAQLVLGHSSALITDAIYAERDAAKVMEVVKGVG